MDNYIKVTQAIKVPFLPIDIWFDRKPKKDIQERLAQYDLQAFDPWAKKK